MWPIQHFKAVFKERLCFVVGSAQRFNRCKRITRTWACPNNPNSNIIDRSRFQNKGPGRLHKTAVVGCIIGCLFGPVWLRVATSAPTKWVGVTREHEVTGHIGVSLWVRDVPTATVNKLGSVFPKTTQIVVIITWVNRVSLIWVGTVSGIRIVKKTSHSKAFVIDNAVAVTDPIQCFVVPDTKCVVDAVVILVRPLKKVNTHSWRWVAIAFETRVVAIIVVTIVIITESAVDVATNVVIIRVSEGAIREKAKIGIVKRLCTAVDQFIVVKRHVIYFIVRSKGKSLRPDFHADRVCACFGMDISFVIHDPPIIEVTVEWNFAFGAAIFGFFDVVPWKITIYPVVSSVIIAVIEWCQVIILSLWNVAMCRPFFDDVWNFIVRKKISLSTGSVDLVIHTGFIPCIEFSDFVLARNKVFVKLATVVIGRFSKDLREWASPVILTISVAQSGKFQLIIDVGST